MPERIVSNLSAIGKWRDEIELALVFWLIGATIGIGQRTVREKRQGGGGCR